MLDHKQAEGQADRRGLHIRRSFSLPKNAYQPHRSLISNTKKKKKDLTNRHAVPKGSGANPAS
jgi:hypothetical protein